jgi:hypothetical protein
LTIVNLGAVLVVAFVEWWWAVNPSVASIC